MNPTNLMLLLTVLSGLVGAVSHSLSDDDGASLLEHFGITWRLPKATVYVAVLACSCGAALIDTLVSGSDWQHALAAAGMAFTATLFGAAKQQTAAAKSVVIGLVLALTVSACSLFSSQNLPTTLIDAGKVACIIEHAFVDDATLNTVCNLVTAEERAAAKDIAQSHREQLGREMKGMRAEACDGGAK